MGRGGERESREGEKERVGRREKERGVSEKERKGEKEGRGQDAIQNHTSTKSDNPVCSCHVGKLLTFPVIFLIRTGTIFE